MISLRAKEIPLWVTVLAIALGLFATAIGLAALANPAMSIGYVPGADQLGTTWAGRNAGLGIVLLVAVVLRNPYAYVVAFAGQIMREVSDLVAAFPSAAGMSATMIFLAADLLGLILALRAVRRREVAPS